MDNCPRILICDDEPLMTESIKAVLGTGKYLIQTTNSSRHALSLIHAEPPDIVILDVKMPGLTGFEVLDAVNRDRCDTAFIIVTGEATVDSAIRAIRQGASDYLRKPFEPDELIMRVETVLKQRQMKHEHMCIKAENRQLENQLRQSQKMEAIGTLAGGIAHDFNNVLSIILGNSELALADMPTDHSARLNLKRILTASLRAREMIQQLLSFSRKEESGRKPLRLNSVVQESLKLIRASLPTNICIERDICATNCTTIADATQIHQIMLNLCTNAAHAMAPHGGVLTIRLAPVSLDEANRTAPDRLAPGNYAKLVVADTGQGIEKDTMERIFDPYFTTKATGKGTGMGLAVVHGIIKASGGTIKVFSEPSRFTEFHIYLPMVDAVIDTEPAIFNQNHLPGGHEHILIVDDEEMLVEMMRQVLEQLGYTVSAYTNSTDARNAFFSYPASYDLLITDMTMPGMTGTDLAQTIKSVRPDLPIIICTGFNEQLSEKNAQSLGIQALIMKPMGMQQLAETVRNVLAPRSMERRKNPRFMAPAKTFVISSTHPLVHCQLVDIGTRGLAFNPKMARTFSNPADQLAIMTPDGEIFISGIHYRTVADISAGKGIAPARAGQARRSVCFENLTTLQRELIDRFIRQYTAKRLH